MSGKIAVIGASSFSGKAFVDNLRNRDREVIWISRPDYDLNASDEIAALIELSGVSCVVNFAALNMVAESWLHASDYYRSNLIGVAKLCDRLIEWQGRFVQVSTPEVYGAIGGMIKEGSPFVPSTPYAVSRAAVDMHLRAMHKTHGFDVCFTRSVNVYGPGQQAYRIIPKTVLKILRGEKLKLHGGGISRRAWVHIDDAVEAIYRIAMSGKAGEDYHIATPDYLSIRDVVAMICETMNVRFSNAVETDKERPGKDFDYRLDDAKIRTELGWKERVKFEDGLRDTVKWFTDHAANYKDLEYTHRP